MFINIFNVLYWFLNIIMQFTDQLRCFRNLLVSIFCDIVFFDILGFSNYFGSLFHQPVCLHQSFALFLDIKRILVRFNCIRKYVAVSQKCGFTLISTPPRSTVINPPCMSRIIFVVLLTCIFPAGIE